MIQAGQYITDGTCVWIVDDIRDGARVGDIVMRPTLRDGYILADGSSVTASEYPRLLAFVQSNNLITTDTTDVSKYRYDSTTDTLIVPNAVGRVMQGGSAVGTKEAGLPNITGAVRIAQDNTGRVGTASGALDIVYASDVYVGAGHNGQDTYNNAQFAFDASLSNSIYGNSNTVQPPAIEYLPQIKY